MTTVSFKKAAILSYIAQRKDLPAVQRRALRGVLSGRVSKRTDLPTEIEAPSRSEKATGKATNSGF